MNPLIVAEDDVFYVKKHPIYLHRVFFTQYDIHYSRRGSSEQILVLKYVNFLFKGIITITRNHLSAKRTDSTDVLFRTLLLHPCSYR